MKDDFGADEIVKGESRWHYWTIHKFKGRTIATEMTSKFLLGKVTITFAELQEEWPEWNEDERREFVGAIAAAGPGMPGLADIYRFLWDQGSGPYHAVLALSIASSLPQNEAFSLLCAALKQDSGPGSSNLYQAIAATKHPRARTMLREYLGSVLKDPDLMLNDEHYNWAAAAAVYTISHLIELGADPNEFADEARELSSHPCASNRHTCQVELARFYRWMKPEDPAYLESLFRKMREG